MHRIITAAADGLAARLDIPAESRAAFTATAVSVWEQQVCAVIGADTVRITGWKLAPSTRAARRLRIIQAIQAGHGDGAIAQRECVSRQRVQQLRRQVQPQISPPEK